MEKEKYISDTIARLERLKESIKNSTLSRLSVIDKSIEKTTNLSDEEYDVIEHRKTLTSKGDKKLYKKMTKKLSKIGLTLEDMDNMSFEDCEKFNNKI